MADMREKMVALIRQIVIPFWAGEIADHLIANDVIPVVHGEWEHLESGWHDLWRCTSCGDEWTFEYDPTDKETMVNFCPNCGADMRERKGDE